MLERERLPAPACMCLQALGNSRWTMQQLQPSKNGIKKPW